MKCNQICLLILIFQFVFICSSVHAQDCYCTDCADCLDKIVDTNCTTIYLTQDIVDSSTYGCLFFGEYENNKTFDCQGHIIDGSSGTGNVGITIGLTHGIDIINCKIINYSSYGIRLADSYSIALKDNEIAGNDYSGGLRVYYTHESTFSGNYIHGSVIGIVSVNSHNNYYISNIIQENGGGIEFNSSSNNKILYNIITGNSFRGIGFNLLHKDLSSVNNIVNWNKMCNGSEDIYVEEGCVNNTGINNICDIAINWNDNGSTGCTYTCSENVPTISEWGIVIILISISTCIYRAVQKVNA